MPLPLQVNKQNTQARVRAITFLLLCVFVVCITFLLFANKLIRCGCCCCCCWRWCVSLFWHIAVKFAQSNLWLLFTVTVTVACVFNSSDGSQFHTSLWYALLDFAWVNGSFFFVRTLMDVHQFTIAVYFTNLKSVWPAFQFFYAQFSLVPPKGTSLCVFRISFTHFE